MTRFRIIANRHARLSAMCVLALFAAIFAFPVLVYGPVDLSDGRGMIELPLLLSNLPVQLMTCVIVLGAVAALGWWQQTRLITPFDCLGLRMSLYITAIPLTLFAILAILLLTEGDVSRNALMLLVIICFNLLVGLFEETLFRGIVFHGLRTAHSLWFAILASSLLFGLFHMVNLAIGQGWDITIFQVVNATALGIFFCAILLQSGNLWPAIVLHAVWNSYAMAGQLAVSHVPLDDLQPDDLTVTPANYILPLLILLSAVWIITLWHRRQPPPMPVSRDLP